MSGQTKIWAGLSDVTELAKCSDLNKYVLTTTFENECVLLRREIKDIENNRTPSVFYTGTLIFSSSKASMTLPKAAKYIVLSGGDFSGSYGLTASLKRPYNISPGGRVQPYITCSDTDLETGDDNYAKLSSDGKTVECYIYAQNSSGNRMWMFTGSASVEAYA